MKWIFFFWLIVKRWWWRFDDIEKWILSINDNTITHTDTQHKWSKKMMNFFGYLLMINWRWWWLRKLIRKLNRTWHMNWEYICWWFANWFFFVQENSKRLLFVEWVNEFQFEKIFFFFLHQNLNENRICVRAFGNVLSTKMGGTSVCLAHIMLCVYIWTRITGFWTFARIILTWTASIRIPSISIYIKRRYTARIPTHFTPLYIFCLANSGQNLFSFILIIHKKNSLDDE